VSSFKEKLRRGVINAQRAIKHVSAYSTVLNSMGNQPGFHNYVGAGVGLSGVVLEHLRAKLFDDSKLHSFQFVSGAGHESLCDVLMQNSRIIGQVDEWTVFDLQGVVLYGQRGDKTFLCGKDVTPQRAKAALAKLLWDSSQGFISVRTICHWAETYGMETEPITQLYDSHYAQNILAGIRRYASHKKSRSVLLCGSPGSGKTALVYRVCAEVAQRTVILECTHPVGTKLVMSIVQDLAPDAIILNELNNSYGGTLENLEYLNKSVPLVLATANRKDQMHPALLRPGRFDEILDVEQIDDMVYQNLVSFPVTPATETALRTWPVAYVSELRNRVDVEPDRFDHHFKDLSERLAYIQEKYRAKD